MTTTVYTCETMEAPNVIRRAADTAAVWWQSARHRRHQRDSVRRLRAMTDHQLRDVGIHRSEITSVVYGTPGGSRTYHA